MKVTVEDDRVWPEYKNVQITAVVRNIANHMGIDWDICLKIGAEVLNTLQDADYISDDVGRTWARSFTPKGDRMNGH